MIRYALVGIALFLFITLLQIGTNVSVSKKNLDMIEDLIEKLDLDKKIKIQKILDWHRKYGYPVFVERSIKYSIETNRYNRDRFTIVIPLSYFFKDSEATMDTEKWLEWSNIMEMPFEIEKKCIDYMGMGMGDVDFIWGLDYEAGKEKIYVEDLEKGKIEGFVFHGKEITERYIYHKKSLPNHPRFSFMYNREDLSKNKIDSYHVALKKPIELALQRKKYYIYLVSMSPGKSYTFYYRTN